MKMLSSPRLFLLGTATLWTAAVLAVAAPVPTTPTETPESRAGLHSSSCKYQPLPGKVVGVLTGDVALMGQEGAAVVRTPSLSACGRQQLPRRLRPRHGKSLTLST